MVKKRKRKKKERKKKSVAGCSTSSYPWIIKFRVERTQSVRCRNDGKGHTVTLHSDQCLQALLRAQEHNYTFQEKKLCIPKFGFKRSPCCSNAKLYLNFLCQHVAWSEYCQNTGRRGEGGGGGRGGRGSKGTL